MTCWAPPETHLETEVKSKFFRWEGTPGGTGRGKGQQGTGSPADGHPDDWGPVSRKPWEAGQDTHQLLHPRVQDASVLPPSSLCHWLSTLKAINVPPYQAAAHEGEAALRWNVGTCRRILEPWACGPTSTKLTVCSPGHVPGDCDSAGLGWDGMRTQQALHGTPLNRTV